VGVFVLLNWFAALSSLAIVTAPGALAVWLFLAGAGLARFERFFLSLCVGLFAVPLLAFLEGFLLGVPFTAGLVLFNAVVLLAASTGAWFYFKFKLPSFGSLNAEKAWKLLKNNWVLALLLAFILVGFYVRLAPAHSTEFFEFDPFYYDKLTQQLVQDGHIDVYSDDAYYPFEAFRHYAPLAQYVQGSWYAVYSLLAGLAEYSKDELVLISQLYPPIVGALLSFLAFVIIREEFNEYAALVPAAFFALTPQVIKKLAAGVNEQQPWGFFTALLIFALLILVANRRDWRLAVLAGLSCAAAALGSQQYVWPFMILAVYLIFQSVVDFLARKTNLESIKLNAVIVAGAWLGSLIVNSYEVGKLGAGLGFIHYLMALGLGLSVLFYFVEQKLGEKSTLRNRVAVLFGLFLLSLPVLFVFTSFGWTAVYVVESQVTMAKAGVPLAKTIQEEAATSESFWVAAYGVLNPPLLLLGAALATAATAVLDLAARKRRRLALGWAALVTALVVFNNFTDGIVTWLASFLGGGALSGLAAFYSSNDVFLYMLIALASAVISYGFGKEDRRTTLLLILVFFPIAYIGLNKLKYMVHLAVALCLVAGYLLGEAARVLTKGCALFRLADDAFAAKAGIAFILLVGVIGAFAQAQTVSNTMYELEYSRIPGDWLETFKWMAAESPADARIMSWWDYGHWTTFLGERKTVLDPVNERGLLNHGVAQAFVNGEDSDLYDLMDYHGATHVMVDWELVSKWGALVYLSGTCDSSISVVCPTEPAITDWEAGPGRSRYEAEHYFEFLDLVGTCPVEGPSQMAAYQSGFGSVYCLTSDSFLLLSNTGLVSGYQRPIALAQPGVTEFDANTSYVVPSFFAENQLINVNPDLSVYGLESKAMQSAFTKLFFFEEFPGFKLVYRSPNSIVKVFEYQGRP